MGNNEDILGEEAVTSKNTEKSAFNTGLLDVLRLNDLWKKVNILKPRGDLVGLRWLLDTIQDELSGDMIRLCGDSFDNFDKWDEDNKYLAKLKEIDDKIQDSTDKDDKRNLYNHLRKKQLLLLAIQLECGKGAKYVDPTEDEGLI